MFPVAVREEDAIIPVATKEGAFPSTGWEKGTGLPTAVNEDMFPVAAREEDATLPAAKKGSALCGGMVGGHHSPVAAAATPGAYSCSCCAVAQDGATVCSCPEANRCPAATKHPKHRRRKAISLMLRLLKQRKRETRREGKGRG